MAKITFTTFAEVQNALQTFVVNNGIPVNQAPHGNMWEMGATADDQYNYFVTQDAIPGFKILTPGNGDGSNIILALRGDSPFDGSTFPRMPENGPYLDDDTINAICAWIKAGAKQ